MKKYISKSILKNTLIYLITCIILFYVLKIFNLMFRQWVGIALAIILVAGLITGTFQLIFKIKKKILKIGLSIVFAVILAYLMLHVYFLFIFDIYKPEHVVYKDDKKYIAYVHSHFISNVNVEYYEYKNIFVVGNKPKIREVYEEGAFDPIKNKIENGIENELITTIYYYDNIHYENAKKETIKVLEKNIKELEEIAKELILSKDNDWKKHDKVQYGYGYKDYNNKEYIQFDLDAQGFLGGQYWGLQYSLNDDYLDGVNIKIYDEKERTGKGNDIFIIEKIKENWYFYYDDYDGKVNIKIIERCNMNDKELIIAHGFSINNKETLLKDKKCGCFYCLKVFNPNEIKEWSYDRGETAICPYCNIDAIIGESSNYPITKEFLEKMKEYWF